MLLSAPKYFNLKETNPGTVLVENGVLVKEDISEKYGNRQFYFMDKADGQLKCLSGGSLNYVVDLHNLQETKMAVKITYDGMTTLESGKYAGKEAHQFKVEADDSYMESMTGENAINAQEVKAVQDAMVEKNPDALE